MDTVDENDVEIISCEDVRRPDGTMDLTATLRGLLERLVNTAMYEQAGELREVGVSRNGYRERSLDTVVGSITLRIPKFREGSYFPDDIVRRWSRTDTALAAVVCDMWVDGVSTRKVDGIAGELGVKTMSRSRVSRLCEALDGEVAALREGDLSAVEWPYLWLDATYVHCREAGAARCCAVVTAVAADVTGHRRIIGIESIDTESYVSWREFLASLRSRGLSGTRLVVSDSHSGLVRAIRETLIGASWQRCIAHLERDVSDRCRSKGIGSAAVASLKAAFAEEDPALVRAGYVRATELLSGYDERGGELLRDAEAGALAYLDFPREHRSWIRTNNVQERLNAEIKRRTKVVQVFPSVASLVRLIGAFCCEQNDAWLSSRFIDPRFFEPAEEDEPEASPDPADITRVMHEVEDAFDKRRRAA